MTVLNHFSLAQFTVQPSRYASCFQIVSRNLVSGRHSVISHLDVYLAVTWAVLVSEKLQMGFDGCFILPLLALARSCVLCENLRASAQLTETRFSLAKLGDSWLLLHHFPCQQERIRHANNDLGQPSSISVAATNRLLVDIYSRRAALVYRFATSNKNSTATALPSLIKYAQRSRQ